MGSDGRNPRYDVLVRSMPSLHTIIERIETGEASAKEARPAIAQLLQEGSEKSLGCLYACLGTWLWKSLEGCRRDEELREWSDILRRTSAGLTTRNLAYAERLRAFCDLLQMSINTSKSVAANDGATALKNTRKFGCGNRGGQ